MAEIRLLDQKTIDKIAAGEVVERPASCIKELVENAIDAGADRITVEIRDGGIRMLRVSDNGCGIESGDLERAFLRHATSKIRNEEDLTRIGTLGFRGEALSSIAAVSRVELITKTRDELSATRFLIEGGIPRLKEEIGAPDGTTIIVRDLFFNTPARAKFLKSPMTEAARIGDFIEQLILSNTGIAFSFIVNGQQKLSSPGNGQLKDALYHIYGRETASMLIPLSYEQEGLRIDGMIGKPQLSRGNRNFENYYVNGRYIKNNVIRKGIEDGYSTRLMQHQYPFSCLMLNTDPAFLDVNVHPSKMEVRFSDEKRIYDAFRNAVDECLKNQDQILLSKLEKEKEEKKGLEKAPEPFENAGRLKTPLFNDRAEAEKSEVPLRKENDFKEPLPKEDLFKEKPLKEEFGKEDLLKESLLKEEKSYAGEELVRNEGGRSFVQQTFVPEFMSEKAAPMRRMIGVAFDTYWICEYGTDLFLFDQHAAHERVLYERFMAAYEKRNITSQNLMPPLAIHTDAHEEMVLREGMDAFTSLGFEIEEFGDRTWLIRAVPYTIGNIASDKLFREMLDQLDFTKKLQDNKMYIRIVATEACKAAVKGGERISTEEATRLLDELMRCSDPYHCPHGRPTIISFSEKELEKRFKRIV
ncbi:MAG: DNA mismatch repair endonuclease MutL [Lachnospiraceae bacterium]|nr:DNA mismatch repair endonuclease MutL [Lachnospiraceae bacterium]